MRLRQLEQENKHLREENISLKKLINSWKEEKTVTVKCPVPGKAAPPELVAFGKLSRSGRDLVMQALMGRVSSLASEVCLHLSVTHTMTATHTHTHMLHQFNQLELNLLFIISS